MGRGKGNVDHYVCLIKPGRILFEVKSRDTLSVIDALGFTLRKFPMKTQVIGRVIKL
jgi:large subunit ribosomal protein L16